MLSHILILEVYRTEVAEIRMVALPIVKYFNTIENIRLHFLAVTVKLAVN